MMTLDFSSDTKREVVKVRGDSVALVVCQGRPRIVSESGRVLAVITPDGVVRRADFAKRKFTGPVYTRVDVTQGEAG